MPTSPTSPRKRTGQRGSGMRFNRQKFGLRFGLKNGVRFRFDSETCLNYPFLSILLVCGITRKNSSCFSSQNSSYNFSIELVPSIVDSLWPVGFLPGMALSSVIQSKLGFIYNFAFGMLAALLAMLYTIVFVKDSRILKARRDLRDRAKEKASGDSNELEPLSSGEKEQQRTARTDDASPWKAFKSFFKLSNIKLGFLATFKKREDRRRATILLTVAIFLLG